MSSRNIYDPYSCLVGLSSLSSSSGDVFKLDVCLSCRRLISHSCSLYSLDVFVSSSPPPCCQCVPWPVDWNMPAVCLTTFDAKWLIYLLCNTPNLLLWNPPPLCFHLRNLGVDVVHFIRHWLCKTVFLLLASGCWALTCWDGIVLFIDCTFVCLSGPLQPSHRMSWPLINSTGLVRACYPVHFLANCSSH